MAEKTAASITDFDPTTVNDVYVQHQSEWELNRDFAEMHLKALRDGDYLDKFGKSVDSNSPAHESDHQYSWRKEQSFAMDPCADLINLRVDNIFRSPPIRQYDESPHKAFIEDWLRDVDGGGTDMTAFMRKALVKHYINGVDFVVDKARTDLEPTTLAQEQAMGIRPYLHAFGPLERMDWACNHAGKYLWARYKLGAMPAPDEQSGVPSLDEYLTVSDREWRLYEVPTDDESGAGVHMTSGPITIGVCPIVSFYFKESSRADSVKVPLSLLTRIAPIARYLLNLLSQLELDTYTSISFWAIAGADPEGIPREMAPCCVWALPDGATVHDMGGETKQIQVKMDFIRMLIDTILRIGKLTDTSGQMQGRAASGVQVAVERTDLDNEMRMTAIQAEQVERDLVWLAICRHTGKLISKDEIGYTVEYNKKYVLTPVGELIKHLAEFVKTGADSEVPAATKILLRKILNAVSNEDDKLYQDALKEIDDAVFGGAMPDEVIPPAEVPAGEGGELDGTEEVE